MWRGASILSFALLAACGPKQTMVLDSDVPNVLGLDAVLTRDIERRDGELVGVEVLYRGEITDFRAEVAATTAAFGEHGWSFTSHQARGRTTLLNYSKPPRWAQVQLAQNEIDPMMSSGLLRVGTGTPEGAGSPGISPDGMIGPPEGFAPPPIR